jgi:hypothetical protein
MEIFTSGKRMRLYPNFTAISESLILFYVYVVAQKFKYDL